MWHEVIRSWTTVWRNVVISWRHIVVAHLVYTGLGVIILFPLTGLLGRMLLLFSGEPALADQDILYFALTPLGAASFFVLISLFVFILAFEQATLMAIGIATQRGESVTAVVALRHSVNKAPQIFEFALRLVAKLLLITLPFIAIAAAIAFWLLTDHDINFYLSNRPPAFWVAASLIGVSLLAALALLVYKLLDWSMSLPLILFGNIIPEHSFRQSRDLSRANRGRLVLALMGWAFATLVLGSVAMTIIKLAGSLLIPITINSLQWLVLVLGGLLAVWMFANLIITAWTSGTFACLITHFFNLTQSGSGDDRPGLFDRSTPATFERKFTIRKLLTYFVFATVAAGLAGIWLLNGIQVRDDVAVIAHRGAAGSAPENTIAAVRQAINDGADWIEIDVQETRDGAVVVIHDRDFMKLAGINLNVWDSTLEQLSDIDVGSWFGPEFSDQRVPTLADVLREAKGKSGVVSELKYYGHDERLEERVIDVVERLDMIDEVMIMSLSYAGMQKVRLLRPDWTIGLLAAQAAGNLARLDVEFLAVSSRIATPQFIRSSQAAGKPVYVWTINDALNMSRMISLGVDGIITDEPELAREVLADRNELNSVERLLVQMAYLMGWQSPASTYRDNSP